ncbi:MAG TPA: DUF397 domain-containing protein [Streptosporangiaceae bacterium]|nr:DUF397 domain-containing protein [Streptosporangiaceae bacterium]
MHDLRRAEWRTSTFSGGNGSCVQVASNLPGIIAIRDSKDPQGPALVFTPRQWTAFLAGIRAGEFGL